METSTTPQVTDFTRDVTGRYVCNELDEAMHSTNVHAKHHVVFSDVHTGELFAGDAAGVRLQRIKLCTSVCITCRF